MLGDEELSYQARYAGYAAKLCFKPMVAQMKQFRESQKEFETGEAQRKELLEVGPSNPHAGRDIVDNMYSEGVG